jgi:hypothetical protein
MSKFTALAIGLLSVISIVPTAQAATGISNQGNLQQPAGDLHAQVIIRLGGPPAPYHREDFDRHRQWQIERERQAERRREFYSRRHREHEGFHREGGEFRGETRVEFRGEPRFEPRVEPRPEPRPPH